MRYVAFYGCEPSSGVPADSKLVRVLFGHFWQQAEKNGDGKINIPTDVVGFFGIDGRVEKLIVGQPIVLAWHDPDSETEKETLCKTFNSKRSSHALAPRFLGVTLNQTNFSPDED